MNKNDDISSIVIETSRLIKDINVFLPFMEYFVFEIFDSGTMQLPLPSLAILIPTVHSLSNFVKSGSNTTTKLIDDGKMSLPY